MGESGKRSWTSRNTEDRLSSFHDDILIGILSRFPLHLAIVTGSLSCRWRDLWKKITSINIGSSYSKYLPEIMMQITSPLIYSICIEFHFNDFNERTNNRNWSAVTSLICKNANVVRELKITCRPWLHSTIRWPVGSSPINLPNLKSLSLVHSPDDYESLGTVIEACPSLEELSLICESNTRKSYDFKCSNPNIRRLFMKTLIKDNLKVVINTPKLEYLSIRTQKLSPFCFEKEPIELREANIIFVNPFYPSPTQDEIKVISNFYTALHNAMFLTLYIFGQQNISRVFPNATRLTLTLYMRYDDVKAVLSLLELCPALEFLNLTIVNFDIKDYDEILQKPAIISTSLQVLKRLEIKVLITCDYRAPSNSFLGLVEYLLSSAINLKYLCITLVIAGYLGDDNYLRRPMDFRRELEFCELLYRYSVGCKVEYVGKLVNMSGESGSEIWKVNDDVIPFS